MLRKYFPIFILLLTYGIILGHNIFPHHHFNNSTTRHNHSGNHHHHHFHNADHHGNETEQSGNFFANIIHANEEISFISCSDFKDSIPKLQPCTITFLPINVSLESLYISQKADYPPDRFNLYASPSALFSGLRAPPVFTI